MADIFANSNLIITSMINVIRHLEKTYFTPSENIQFEIELKRLKSFFNLDSNEVSIFCLLLVEYFDYGEKPINIGILSKEFNITPLRLLEFRDEFVSLEEKGFIYSDSSDNKQSLSKYYRVSEQVVEAIIQQDKKLLENALRIKDRNLTYSEDIQGKTLYYPKEIEGEISKLYEYLKKENLEAIQSRLVEKAMPKGVCIMLYGKPGTGKTETVYQLAKKTGRAIFHVDIGNTISHWMGGTVNNLKQVFEKYEQLCKQLKSRGEEIPILLFNEADALFGKRIEPPRQGSEIDENHTQSFLLDSIEKQEGIIIATTNIAGNFDEAFERRFLFKIKFEQPNLEIKKKIWKNKVSWLRKDSVEEFASCYDFSGAEIENVVRKATMNEVLTGKRSSVKEIKDYCETEKIEKNNRMRIGFGC
ncbi:MAG: ATP-binding protein [Treponema sp.]|nr:ATP-binding protein [Treponema sp.]